MKLANQHTRVANQRQDFLQKTTTESSKKYATIRIEDLKISGMVANHKLFAAISDLGFNEFRRQLSYKQSHYGSNLYTTLCNKAYEVITRPFQSVSDLFAGVISS